MPTYIVLARVDIELDMIWAAANISNIWPDLHLRNDST